MSQPLTSREGAFVRELRAARATTFTPHRDGVLMGRGGPAVLLTPQQVSDLLALYERETKAAEAEAERCRKLRDDLWSARCDALDRCGAALGSV